MSPQPIEIQKRELNEPLKSKHCKQPAPYAKAGKKNPLSAELEEGSLTALKDLLAKHKSDDNNPLAIAPASPLLPLSEISTTYSFIAKIEPSGQVMDLYEKLLESIVSIHRDGIQETTFFLDGNAFNTSIFHGAKITITEYSTAPKVFNIQFSANSQAINFFESHAADLLIALQKEHFGFSVNRLDTSLMSEDEKHALRRVERDLDKEEDA